MAVYRGTKAKFPEGPLAMAEFNLVYSKEGVNKVVPNNA
jgi:hypothetical protein